MESTAAFMLGVSVGSAVAACIAWWAMRRHVRKLREAQRRARSAERLAEIGSMTGGLAHEIKNPLSTIGLNAQLIAEGIDELPGEPEEKERLGRRVGSLVREVDRLRGILTDFLQYAGEPRIDRRRADINQVVDEVGDFFAPECQKQNVRLRIEKAPGTLWTRVDVAALKQSLLNLMLNSVEAIAGHGGSTGSPRELILRTSHFQNRALGPSIRIHVIDTGPGMSHKSLQRIFDPYFTTKATGTGLGLPTARKLIEAHEGRLDVHSEAGRGTEFIVTLPIVDEPADGSMSAEADASMPRAKA